METLKILDSRDYRSEWDVCRRTAVSAVIERDGKLALLKNRKYGFYIFPGRVITAGEPYDKALICSTFEQIGLNIDPKSVKPFIHIIERRRKDEEEKVLEQHSYYYACDILGEIVFPDLVLQAEYLPCLAEPFQAEVTDFSLALMGGDAMLFREGYVFAQINGKPRFFVSLPEITGSCWHEFTSDEFAENHWRRGSMYISDEDMDATGLCEVLYELVPDYDRYGISRITQDSWNKIYLRAEEVGGALAAAVFQLDGFMLDVLESVGIVTILGI